MATLTHGLLCRCSACGREERTGTNPLRDGWPRCCGYTMTLIDTEQFIASIDSAMKEIFAPVQAARRAARDL
jgi:hypothetical protein